MNQRSLILERSLTGTRSLSRLSALPCAWRGYYFYAYYFAASSPCSTPRRSP